MLILHVLQIYNMLVEINKIEQIPRDINQSENCQPERMRDWQNGNDKTSERFYPT